MLMKIRYTPVLFIRKPHDKRQIRTMSEKYWWNAYLRIRFHRG